MGTVRYAGATDVGRVRDQNEDRWGVDVAQGLYVVSDGMGGAAHGEIAAQAVVDLLPSHVQQAFARGLSSTEIMTSAIAELSDELHVRSAAEGLAGVSATVVAALVNERACVIGYLGDSPAFLLRGGELRRLTVDHTVAQALLDAGEITPEQAATHRARNILTRYAGMQPPAKATAAVIALQPFDRILLCSDGISGELDPRTLTEITGRGDDLQSVCQALVAAANEAGGRDNMTAVLIDVGEPAEG